MRSDKPALFGIVGYPLSTTWSPFIHEAGFRALKLPHRYLPVPIAPGRLRPGMKALEQLGVQGFNVTVPHKEAVLPLLASSSRLVKTLGAANTVTARRNGWHGENTDVLGFASMLWPYANRISKCSAVVLGAGGAARAAIYALLRHFEMSAVLVVARKSTQAHGLAKWGAELAPTAAVSALNLSKSALWRGAFKEAALIVQTTPVGQGDDGRILPAGWRFDRKQIACDLVYGYPTDFLKRARSARAVALDGTGMLLAQAAAAFELFTGRPYPWAKVKLELKRRGV